MGIFYFLSPHLIDFYVSRFSFTNWNVQSVYSFRKLNNPYSSITIACITLCAMKFHRYLSLNAFAILEIHFIAIRACIWERLMQFWYYVAVSSWILRMFSFFKLCTFKTFAYFRNMCLQSSFALNSRNLYIYIFKCIMSHVSIYLRK